MNLRPLFFSILFTCALCTPIQSSNTDRNDLLSLSKRAWSVYPSDSTKEPPVVFVEHVPTIHQCTPNAIIDAWTNTKRKKIDDWPDAENAYATTFGRLTPAIITKKDVWPGMRTKYKDELLVLKRVGQLLASGTKKGPLGRETIYTVRRCMGHSMVEAERNGLMPAAMTSLIKEAAKEYWAIGVFHSGAVHSGGDIRKEFAYEMDKESKAYVRAHRIAWKGLNPDKYLDGANQLHVCDVVLP